MASRTDQARELALRLVEERPGVQQRDLVAAVQAETDLASSTITRMLQSLERDGAIEGRLDGRRKAYAAAGAAAPEAERPAEASPTARGSRGELVAVVTALFIAASLVAFVLAPDKNGDDSSGAATPVAAPAPTPAKAPSTQAAPPPKAKPKPKSPGALAAARRTQLAVLSGSPVPGIARKTAAALKRRGFRVGTVGNAPGATARSVVLYARGEQAAAEALAASITIGSTKPVDPSSQGTALGAGLIVVIGADRRR